MSTGAAQSHPSADTRCYDAATPHQVPGWDRLAIDQSFYVSADWLRFADTDRIAHSRYLGLVVGGDTVAAVSSHSAANEIDPGYVAARTLQLPPGAGAATGHVLTLGGRRGFRSGVLVDALPDTHATAGWLAKLIDQASGAAGAWWWPYLDSADVQLVSAAADRTTSGVRAGIHLVGADCLIGIVGDSLDDHVAALPTKQRRTNFRREHRRFVDSGLTIQRVSLAEHWPRLGPMLAAVQHKYGHRQSADEMSARLRRQSELLGSRAIVFACVANGTMVGFSLAYQWGEELALRVVGFDYGRLLGADEYAQLAVHEPLRHCYAHGLRRLHLGTGSYEAKCRRGAQPRPLWAVTSMPGQDPHSVAEHATRMAASMPAHESASFISQVSRSYRGWTGTD